VITTGAGGTNREAGVALETGPRLDALDSGTRTDFQPADDDLVLTEVLVVGRGRFGEGSEESFDSWSESSAIA